jgi:hypothetical protein
MFQKLYNDVVIDNYSPLEETISYGHEVDGQFRGISYSFVHLNSRKLYDLVPMKYWSNFYTQLMHINTQIPPHTDSGIKFTINCYIKTDNCLTQFYKLNSNNPKITKLPMQTTGRIYDEADLIKTDSFIAKPNEVWVLDVSQPHAVFPLGEFKERVAITLSSMIYNYDDVCNMLHETGNL